MARKECDIVISSIFVNPTQFSAADKDGGASKYPKTLEADFKLLKSHGVDAVFAPSTLYSPDHT